MPLRDEPPLPTTRGQGRWGGTGPSAFHFVGPRSQGRDRGLFLGGPFRGGPFHGGPSGDPRLSGAPAPRRILHLDIDAFLASVEQALHPDLAGKPVVVGGLPSERNLVMSCSYEARACG